MRIKLALLLIILISLSFGCSAQINPVFCDINIRQGNTKILNGTSIFDFGSVPIDLSKFVDFTIENLGMTNLVLNEYPYVKITGINSSEFKLKSDLASNIILPNSSITFSIELEPTSMGVKEATIEIKNNDADENPFKFVVRGTCIEHAPEITVRQNGNEIPCNTGSYDFGETNVGSQSAPITFVVHNDGNDDLWFTDIPKIGVNGNDATSFIVEQTINQLKIAGGSETTFQISFKPTYSGVLHSQIVIGNNDSDENPYIFELYGTGVAVPEINVRQESDNIENTTGSYDFGSIVVNYTSEVVEFAIENLGTAILHLNKTPYLVNVTGVDASMFPIERSTTSQNIQPGSFTTFSLTFAPTDTGIRSAIISIYSDDSDENPYTFTVKGTATQLVSGDPIAWIGGGSDGWKTGIAPSSASNDYNGFVDPTDVCVGNDGSLYIADTNGQRICKWDKNGNAIGWIGGGSNGWKTSTSPAYGRDYQSFRVPYGVFVDGNGDIYVADTGNNRISKWDSNGNAIGWIGGGSNGWQTRNAPSSGHDYRSFYYPKGVYVTSSYIYVADTYNSRICRWRTSDGRSQGWIGGGIDGWQTADSPSSYRDYRSFNMPNKVCIYSNVILVADENNYRVSKWSTGGTASGWIGADTNGWQTGNMPYSSTTYQGFYWPCSVFYKDSYLYITDWYTHRINKWSHSGNAIGWIGKNSSGWSTNSGTSSGNDLHSFKNPYAACIDSEGNIYVVDRNNYRICKWKE